MNRSELVRLRELGLITDREFLDMLVIEAGDNVKPEMIGKPFRAYMDGLRDELSRLFATQVDEVKVKITDGDLQLDLQFLPAIGVQWINLGITIKKTSDTD